jgi:alkaline phosphatase D
MAMSVVSVRSVACLSGAALVAALCVFQSPVAGADDPAHDPGAFPNGVAAGDVTPTSVILWAHAAVRGPLYWSYQKAGERRDAGHGVVLVHDPEVPVHVTLRNLEPGTRYTYMFASRTGDGRHGTFETPARPYAVHGLRFGVTGDVRGDLAPYPALRNASTRQLDFFVNLGDTIYADVPSPAFAGDQARTLSEFRRKHAEVLSARFDLNVLARLRQSTAWFATIDDHDVTNDFAGGAPPATDPRFLPSAAPYINETTLFTNGLQAFQEFNPLATESYRRTHDARTEGKRRLYRYRLFGQDAALFLLDARSFRDPELPAVQNPADPRQVAGFLAAAFTPGRTMLGRAQIADLEADLWDATTKGVTWKFIMVTEPIQNIGVVAASDRFEGYAAERAELLGFIDQAGITNVVFVTADLHGTLVNNLTYQQAAFGPQRPVDAFEVITGPAAYAQPLGPTLVQTVAALGLISPAQLQFYLASSRAVKDAFVEDLINTQIVPLGYDPLGLDPAFLVKGGYVAAHVFGWTEFDVDRVSQALTITTYGIEPYEPTDLATPRTVIDRQPEIVSQFRVPAR